MFEAAVARHGASDPPARLTRGGGAQVSLTAEVKREREASQDERVLHTERVFGKVTRNVSAEEALDTAPENETLLKTIQRLKR